VVIKKEDGNCSISDNIAENSIKPFTEYIRLNDALG